MESRTKYILSFVFTTVLTIQPNCIVAARTTAEYPVKPVAFTEVHFDDAFWAPRLATSSRATIPACFKRCEETGRIDNFAVAGGLKEGFYRGARYNDSDVYKVIEGAAYQLSVKYDPKLDAYLDTVIAKIAAAQEDDGYLSTLRTITPELDIAKTKGTPQHQLDMYGERRWARCDHGHELYCVGHMYEAAVAHYQATGKRTLLDVATKNADLICEVFGPKEGQIRNVPGHEEIELALVKLYRATADRKYLDMSKFFLDERGHYNGRTVHMHNNSVTYCQDDKPVIEQTEPHGHVVRAVYLYSGMADIAALTGDARYSRAVDAIWDNIVSKRLYLIGSMGVHGYLEGFGPDYVLPNLHAYNETCATVGMALLNLRLFLLHADAKYIDVLERNLYNGVLSGVSLEGNTFFYPNPLASDGTNRKHLRSPWFSTACCPSNIARFMPSLPGYVYAHTDDELHVNLYVGASANVELGGETVKVTQRTDYPWDGRIDIAVSPDEPTDFSILLRVPGWARNQPVPSDLYRFMHDSDEKATLKVNGKKTPVAITKGYARIRRRWKKGDTITLDIPMPIRRVLAHSKVTDNAGLVAVQRGPIVYCAEWKDNGGRALDLVLPDSAKLIGEPRRGMLGGITVVSARVGSETLTMIPYYAWAHRGAGEMTVWLSRKWQQFTASHAEDGTSAAALGDGLEPANSADDTIGHFSWGLYRTNTRWIRENFPRPRQISSVEVYWLDNESTGGHYRVPRSWQVLYRDVEGWKPVTVIGKSRLPIAKGGYNKAAFEPVTATAMRVEVRTSHEFAAGILEWKIN